MREFLLLLQGKNYQKRKVGFIENGTWSPSAGRTMKEIVSTMKNIEAAEPMVTIRSAMKNADLVSMNALADAVCKMKD